MMFPVGKKRETNENALPAYVQVFEKNGAPGGDRTPDPLLRRQLLYPLSYQGIMSKSHTLPHNSKNSIIKSKFFIR